MRHLLVALGILLLAGGSLSYAFAGTSRPDSGPAGAVQAGVVAPDVTLEKLTGGTVNLSEYQGKVVILNFWATWCPPCRAEMPSMEKLYRLMEGEEDFEMLAVNIEKDGGEIVPKFLKRNPHSFPVLLDPQARAQEIYGVYRYPETFIIARNGTVVRKVLGAIDWAAPSMVEYLRFLLNG